MLPPALPKTTWIYRAADKFREKRLLPEALADRAHAYQWLTFGETGIHGYMGPMGFQMLRKAPEKRDQAIIERGQKRMPEILAVLDRQLEGRSYIVGDFSIADCACAPWLEIGSLLGIDVSAFSNVQAWMDRMKARQSWTA